MQRVLRTMATDILFLCTVSVDVNVYAEEKILILCQERRSCLRHWLEWVQLIKASLSLLQQREKTTDFYFFSFLSQGGKSWHGSEWRKSQAQGQNKELCTASVRNTRKEKLALESLQEICMQR